MARRCAPLALAAATLLALTMGLAGCGSSETPSPGGQAPATTRSATSAATSPSASKGTGARGGLMTVSGRVSAGVEAGCLVLTPEGSPDEPWLLIGRTEGLAAGQAVTLRGARMDTVATTCQQGLPFHVEEVLRTG